MLCLCENSRPINLLHESSVYFFSHGRYEVNGLNQLLLDNISYHTADCAASNNYVHNMSRVQKEGEKMWVMHINRK